MNASDGPPSFLSVPPTPTRSPPSVSIGHSPAAMQQPLFVPNIRSDQIATYYTNMSGSPMFFSGDGRGRAPAITLPTIPMIPSKVLNMATHSNAKPPEFQSNQDDSSTVSRGSGEFEIPRRKRSSRELETAVPLKGLNDFMNPRNPVPTKLLNLGAEYMQSPKIWMNTSSAKSYKKKKANSRSSVIPQEQSGNNAAEPHSSIAKINSGMGRPPSRGHSTRDSIAEAANAVVNAKTNVIAMAKVNAFMKANANLVAYSKANTVANANATTNHNNTVGNTSYKAANSNITSTHRIMNNNMDNNDHTASVADNADGNTMDSPSQAALAAAGLLSCTDRTCRQFISPPWTAATHDVILESGDNLTYERLIGFTVPVFMDALRHRSPDGVRLAVQSVVERVTTAGGRFVIKCPDDYDDGTIAMLPQQVIAKLGVTMYTEVSRNMAERYTLHALREARKQMMQYTSLAVGPPPPAEGMPGRLTPEATSRDGPFAAPRTVLDPPSQVLVAPTATSFANELNNSNAKKSTTKRFKSTMARRVSPPDVQVPSAEELEEIERGCCEDEESCSAPPTAYGGDRSVDDSDAGVENDDGQSVSSIRTMSSTTSKSQQRYGPLAQSAAKIKLARSKDDSDMTLTHKDTDSHSWDNVKNADIDKIAWSPAPTPKPAADKAIDGPLYLLCNAAAMVNLAPTQQKRKVSKGRQLERRGK